MPVLKIKEDGEWKKVSKVNMLSLKNSSFINFESSASGVVPNCEHGTAESVLDIGNLHFKSNAVGELPE